ncbi:MAG: PD-(D/E)XK nuclease family protein [Rikenellaceae bacterium]
MDFLNSIATAFYEREKGLISEYCFVFPNRRASLFFQRALASIIREPVFSPVIVTINDLFEQLSSLKQVDRIDALTELWTLYNSISTKKESFDEFIYWGDIILSDFDDVDKYLVDAGKLFANIQDLKEIESDYSFLTQRQLDAIHQFWYNFFPAGSSENKLKFKEIWEILAPLYYRFTEKLSMRSMGYEGMIYRKVASEILSERYSENSSFKKLFSYRKIVFIGFNALNPCEKTLMDLLKRRGMADFYWDYAGEMISNSDNLSSFFIKDNIKRYPSEIEIAPYSCGKCSFEVIGVPSTIGQAKRVMNILKEVGGDINTSVVLPDESLLMPVLYSIPEEVKDVNVTMGYPLKEGGIVSLVGNILELQKGVYYYRRVLQVLQHNYIQVIAGNEANSLIERIYQGNVIYVGAEEFNVHPLFRLIFKETNDISSYLLDILEFLNRSVQLTKIEKEFIFSIYTSVMRLKDLLPEVSADTYAKILSQIIATSTIPFKGEPLSGLQIMGVLETRCLDFENVIICSMNEGIFPKRSFNNSFIPVTLRRGFSLPDFDYSDRVSAYLFYRLISRAKKVYMLYDTRSEGLKSGEVSRYVYQLKYHFGLQLQESIAVQRVELPSIREVVINKDEGTILQLKKLYFPLGESALSASAINTYITCSLKFYYRYIKGFKENENVAEGVEADTFGSIFHNTIADLYKIFKGRRVTSEMLKELSRDSVKIEKAIDDSFLKFMNLKEVRGRNLLTKKLILKYVKQVFIFDTAVAPFEYIDSEMVVNREVELKDGFSLHLKGVMDRLDRIEEGKRIVDYKTGYGKIPKNIDLAKLFSENHDKGDEVVFQLLFYMLIINDKDVSFFEPYLLRNLFKKDRYLQNVNEDMLLSFSYQLGDKLSELFDITVPFRQTSREQNCEYCPYSKICHRYGKS